ncbi:MAG: hypothetical protein KKF12_03440, partial [Proteobacteria bacterium]|nr:hypothetical protein [Desulfobacula sp.]MBU4129852.1 hypothetical protein [Pseudomonadota bacterium]
MSTEKRKATDISKLRQRAEEALEAPFGGNDSLVDFSQEEMKRRIQGELEVTRDRYVHLYNFSP